MKAALFTKVLADRPLDEALARAADIGYDGVELMGRAPHFGPDTTDEEAREIRALADDLGLGIAGVASYTGGYAGIDDAAAGEELETFERFCELADVLGVGYVRHGAGGPSADEASADHYERAAEWLARAADAAADYGVEIGVEIHGNTIVESADDAVALLEAVDRPNVSAIHDAGNMFICGEAYGPASVERLGDRLGHVHVKDVRRVVDAGGPGSWTDETRYGEEAFAFARMGEGDVDHWSLLHALAAAGYDGYVTDECHVPAEAADDGDVDLAAFELAELRRLFETARRAAGADRRA
jgi:sugar phosphate isomerase/epimerase